MRKAVSLALIKVSKEFPSGIGILLLKHVKCKGMVMMPCGKVEDDETLEYAVVREMKEEIGYDLSITEEWEKHIKLFNRASHYERIDKDETFDETVFMCMYDGKQEIVNKEPDKAEFVKWYDLGRIAVSLGKVNGDIISENTIKAAERVVESSVAMLRCAMNLINYNLGEQHLDTLKVKRLNPEAKLPTRAHATDSGLDLYALETVTLWSHAQTLVHTGIAIELKPGYEAQVRSKSGLALKNALFVLNSPGTVDHNYSGEVGVIIYNGGPTNFKIEKGQKIAQLVISKVELPTVVEVDEVYSEGTERGDGGFGSTGRD